MKLKIVNSLGKEVGILEVDEKLKVEEGTDLFKKEISKILKEGIEYLGASKKIEKGKLADKRYVEKDFNEENLGLLENKLLELGYRMEEI